MPSHKHTAYARLSGLLKVERRELRCLGFEKIKKMENEK